MPYENVVLPVIAQYESTSTKIPAWEYKEAKTMLNYLSPKRMHASFKKQTNKKKNQNQ